MQVRLAFPAPVMLVGVMGPQLRPVGTMAVSKTVPANPFSAVMVIVETNGWLALTDAGEVADIAKSGYGITETATVTEWTSDPLVPVTVAL